MVYIVLTSSLRMLVDIPAYADMAIYTQVQFHSVLCPVDDTKRTSSDYPRWVALSPCTTVLSVGSKPEVSP